MDLKDLALFQRCFTGSESGPLPAECANADMLGDGRVDPADLCLTLIRLTGPS